MQAWLHSAPLGDPAAAIEKLSLVGIENASDDPLRIEIVRGRGVPSAMHLFVEFCEDDPRENFRRLLRLSDVDGRSRSGWDRAGRNGRRGRGARSQAAGRITEVRTAGLNIMMSMKEAGKPVSFGRGCAVPLSISRIHGDAHRDFAKHGTRAPGMRTPRSAACTVRPVPTCASTRTSRRMRAIAEEAFALCGSTRAHIPASTATASCARNFMNYVRQALVASFEKVRMLRSHGAVQSGQDRARAKIRRRSLFATADYRAEAIETHLDWSAYPGAGGGFQGAVEMLQQQRRLPQPGGRFDVSSYRATRDERDVTRGRANSLRLAITGQLGPTRSPPTRWPKR